MKSEMELFSKPFDVDDEDEARLSKVVKWLEPKRESIEATIQKLDGKAFNMAFLLGESGITKKDLRASKLKLNDVVSVLLKAGVIHVNADDPTGQSYLTSPIVIKF